jgi:hypothetical protein
MSTRPSCIIHFGGQERFNTVKAAIGSIVGPDHTDRTGKILAEAKAALSEEQSRLKAQQSELGRLLAQLTEARTEASQSSDKCIGDIVGTHRRAQLPGDDVTRVVIEDGGEVPIDR